MSITIKEIAQLAGVSKTTVSKVLNNKDESISQATREKIQKIVKENNYVQNKLAQSLVTKKTNTIGLLIPDIRNPFFTEISRGVEDKAHEEGYNIILCNTDEDSEKEYKGIVTLLGRMIDGIIFAASSDTNRKNVNYSNITIPTVLIDKSVNINLGNLKGTIKLDNFQGAYMATKYLLDNGHRKILNLCGPLNEITSDRLEGYKKALYEYGIEYREDLVVEGKYKIEWGYNFIKNIVNKDFSAIFCGNDLIAIGVIKGLEEMGLNVPNDVSVVGFDDIQIASLITPSLTTIRQPAYDIGYKASEILIRDLENNDIKDLDTLVFKPELIVRSSTKNISKTE